MSQSETSALAAVAQDADRLFASQNTRPVWLWSADGQNLVWANAEALKALNISRDTLVDVVPTAPARRSLQAVGRTQASGHVRGRIEILRVSAGSHQETLVATCKPVEVAGHALVMAMGSKGTARQAPAGSQAPTDSQAPAGSDVPTSFDAPAVQERGESAVENDQVTPQPSPVFVLDIAPSIAPAPLKAPERALDDAAKFAFKPRSRPHRFSFMVDGKGQITDLSSGLADAVGAATALRSGELASEALAERVGDLPPSVFHGLDERHRFSEQQVLWPVSDSAMLVPVRLSGFDEDDGTLRVFGTALTGKALEGTSKVVQGETSEERPSNKDAESSGDLAVQQEETTQAPVDALVVDPLDVPAATGAGLFAEDIAPTKDAAMTMPVTSQVPGGAALAAAASALASGFAAGMAQPLAPATAAADAKPVVALDDILEDGEAEIAGLWATQPSQSTPETDSVVTSMRASVVALDDALEGDEAERAGLWSTTPAVTVEPDAPADVFATSAPSVDQPETSDQDYPTETLNAMKAVAAGLTAGLAGGAAGGVAGKRVGELANDLASDTTSEIANDPAEEVAPSRSQDATQETTTNTPLEQDTASPDDADLSRPERLTFQEIARRLGARITGKDDPKASTFPQGSDDTTNITTGASSDVVSFDRANESTDSQEAGAGAGAAITGGLASGMLSGLEGANGTPDSQGEGGRVLPFTRTEPNAERMVLDRLPLGIIIYSDDAILYGNRAALDMAGVSSLDALKAQGSMEALFAEGLSAGQDEGHGAMTLVRPDGSKLPVTGRVQAARWDGQSAALLSLREHTHADTEAQEASQDASLLAAGAAAAPIAGANAADGALPLVRARIGELEAIIDLASDGVVTLDGEGEIKDLNQAAQALVGYGADDLIGRPFRLLFPEDSRQTALDYLDDMTKQGRLSLFNEGRELECITAQGGLVPVFMTLGRLTDDEPAVFCAVLRDLSPFKQAETDLVEARKAAEEASAHKSDFLARVSHEIRTPLNAVIGFSEVMLEERFGPVGSERYRQYLRDIHTSGEHLMSLLNDLLDLSKIEAGKMDLSFGEVDLNDVVQQCLAIMQPQANQGRIIVRTSLPLSLPKVVADIRSVRQVVLNLMSNAIKFTDPGGQIIVSTLYEPTGEVSLRVRDTGRGMDAADVELALEPFRQVPTTLNQVITGTGLGLPLTKALVEANRAQFGLESTPGEGTLAMMTFPSQRVLAE